MSKVGLIINSWHVIFICSLFYLFIYFLVFGILSSYFVLPFKMNRMIALIIFNGIVHFGQILIHFAINEDSLSPKSKFDQVITWISYKYIF